jgi:hypothetical protein
MFAQKITAFEEKEEEEEEEELLQSVEPHKGLVLNSNSFCLEIRPQIFTFKGHVGKPVRDCQSASD